MPIANPLLVAAFVLTLAGQQALSQPTGNKTLNALEYGGPGAVDLGARITAADATLGTLCGTIEVPPGQTGLRIASAPKLSSCHTLRLRSPINWTTTGLALSSNTVILGDGAAAVQTLPAGAWISAKNLSQIRIENLWVTNPNGTNPTNVLFYCSSCIDLVFNGNHLVAEGGIWTGTTARDYSHVEAGNLTSKVSISNNVLDGQGDRVTLALLQYTQHVTEANNQTRNALYGTEWWGGDANANGAVGNTRWAQDINISNNVDVNVRAGEWGSMGQDITVTGVVADGCYDVCLDAEGSFRVKFSGFTVHNGANGGLATFYLSQHVAFGPGSVTVDSGSSSMLFRLHNSSQNPGHSYDITIHDVNFDCKDTSNLCVAYIEPIGAFKLNNNTFLNSKISSAGINISGFSIAGNQFTYSFVPGSPFFAIAMSGLSGIYSARNDISRNQFRSTPTQPAGSYAINIVSADFNHNDIVVLEGNSTSGFTNDATLTAGSGNASITPIFALNGNSFGANSVTESITGAHGDFRGDQKLRKKR